MWKGEVSMALNASKIKATGGGSTQALVPAGMYPARVAQVLDLGLQPRKAWKGVEKSNVYMLWVTYELVDQFMKDKEGADIEDKPRWISEKMNLFKREQENSTSAKRLEGLDPTGELGDDWSRVGGMPCLVQIVHSKDGKYANIGAVSPIMTGMTVPDSVNPVKVFDIDVPDMAIFNDLPDFLKTMMTSNLEFKGSALEAALGGTTKVEEVEEVEEFDAPY